MNVAGPQEPPDATAGSLFRDLPTSSRAAGGAGFWFMLGYAPLLAIFFVNLWGRPHYQFFPLALLGAFFLAWTRLKEVPRPLVEGPRVVSTLLLVVSFLLLCAATFFWSPWLASIAAFTGLVALLWSRGGKALLVAMVPALVLFLTIVPPPLSADTRLIQHMRVLAVTWSSELLDILGVTHALSGNVIELPRQQLLVDEACSGINSVLITLAACLFYSLWRRRSIIHTLVCLANVLAFVLLGNLIRITLGGWLKFRFGVDILSGTPHEVIGLVLFVSYIAMILSTDQLLVFLTAPSRPPPEPAPGAAAAAEEPKPPVRRMPGTWLRAAGFCFVLVGAVDLGLGWTHYQHSKGQTGVPKSALRAGATFAMPEEIGKWKRLNTEVPPLQKVETRGVYSQVWHYRRGDTLASLALDYPFQGYHDVTLCYTLRGWDLLEQRSRVGRSTNASPPFAEARMQNHVGLHGALWFSVVDERGRWLPGPRLNPTFRESLLQRFNLASLNNAVTYQVQVLSTGFNALRPAEREQVQQFFEEGRMMLWRQLFEQMQLRK